jgi:hypothetical protein
MTKFINYDCLKGQAPQSLPVFRSYHRPQPQASSCQSPPQMKLVFDDAPHMHAC